ncbi:hypothetical protein PG993_005933 [Apiospora rasikravindrae]|uniref:Uncharacterized protein n=1 Tax=Apiospora rasikravindrae TaxID=990691 RepID=A0ABR1TCV8_9PEZI
MAPRRETEESKVPHRILVLPVVARGHSLESIPAACATEHEAAGRRLLGDEIAEALSVGPLAGLVPQHATSLSKG